MDHPSQSYGQISICFDIFHEKLVYSGFPPARSKTKIFAWRICIGLHKAETAVVEDPRELQEATCMPDMIMLLKAFHLPRVREPPVAQDRV